MIKFSYVDLFSGIGGFRVALDLLDGKSKGFSEIDKFAIETYRINYKDSQEHDLGDVTKINKLPQIEVLVGGVPCQSWSVAGKRKGFADPRGKLWFDTIKMVKISKPKVFVFENVKGLADPRNLANLNLITKSFEDLGYIVKHKILNAYDFGLPQNRNRVFVVGFRKDQKKYADNFVFPFCTSNQKQLIDFLEGIEKKEIKKIKINKEDLFNGKIPMSRNASQKNDELNDFFVLCDTRNGHTTIHSWDIRETSLIEKKICMAILRNRRKSIYGDSDGNPMSLKDIQKIVTDTKKSNIDNLVKKKILKYNDDGKIKIANSKNSSGIDGIYRVYLPNSTIFSTLTATGTRDYVATKYVEGKTVNEYKTNFIKEILKKKNFRQISIREALMIQGFSKDYKIIKNEKLASKQIGNSVSPIVVEALFKKIIETGIFN
ncbi:MAG: DNA cytosine methyltransferase [Candidatus Pacebacteria bacterium]|nr:DNA cytosine methyltransferase [Candidatus Paceibacterota bacterium]